MSREARVERATAETTIRITVALDGTGTGRIATGIGFFDHLLEQLARHSLIDLDVEATGDVQVDEHHTVEDCGIVLGRALDQALGDRRGIRRYGDARIPMDETLATCAVDLGGRAFSSITPRPDPLAGASPWLELLPHFLESLAREARMTLHLDVVGAASVHHHAEADDEGLRAGAARGSRARPAPLTARHPQHEGHRSVIGVVDFGSGNTRSVLRALTAVGAPATLMRAPDELRLAERLVLPGVGAAGSAVRALKASGMWDGVAGAAAGGTPLLGICLGAQLMLGGSDEDDAPGPRPAPRPLPRVSRAGGRRAAHRAPHRLERGGPVGRAPRRRLLRPRLLAGCLGSRDGGGHDRGRRLPVSEPAPQRINDRDAVPSGEERGLRAGAARRIRRGAPRRIAHSGGVVDLIPAIDLLDGIAVRLVQGDFARRAASVADPAPVVAGWVRAGVRRLHLVDLDGARAGRPVHLDLASRLAATAREVATHVRIEMGGGLRRLADVGAALDAGMDVAVLGTAAIEDPELLEAAVGRWPDRIAVSIDVRGETVALDGWTRSAAADPVELAVQLSNAGVAQLIVTDVQRDGTRRGPNRELLARIRAAVPGTRLVAAGGIGSATDLRQLAALGVDGAVVGLALVDGSLADRGRPRRGGPVHGGGGLMPLAARLLACLDVADGSVVKGTRFVDLVDAGDPVELAARYAAEGADEIVILDIAATRERRPAMLELIERAADALDVPLTVGGGVSSYDDAAALLGAGADKVSLNSAALRDPSLIARIAERLGSQSVVVAIDAARAGTAWEVHGVSGTEATGRDAREWAREAVERGAGEVLLTSIDRDGTRSGYDLELTRTIADAVRAPVIASGGAGSAADVVEVLTAGGAQAALLASLLHLGILSIPALKADLAARGVPVRPATAPPSREEVAAWLG